MKPFMWNIVQVECKTKLASVMTINGTKDLGKQERASSENGKQAFNDKHSNFDAAYSVALKDIINAIEKSKESKQEE
ncbi:hypothetical protein [Prevotella pallens]|jgi:hypothetical protein|uniref:hypothetical protein n=1 Tax=Prevotella pallens TaxID=60133 RepID=UPI0028D5DF0C|nr:hypothetical protein [Prevotella pallens]